METARQIPARGRAKRIGLWLGVIVAALAALWCCNLIIFHLWASDVPPYATEWHLRWAKYSAIALVTFIAIGAVCARYLLPGRSK